MARSDETPDTGKLQHDINERGMRKMNPPDNGFFKKNDAFE